MFRQPNIRKNKGDATAPPLLVLKSLSPLTRNILILLERDLIPKGNVEHIFPIICGACCESTFNTTLGCPVRPKQRNGGGMAMGSDQSFTNLSCNSVERHPKKSNLSPCKIDTANRPKNEQGVNRECGKRIGKSGIFADRENRLSLWCPR